MNYEFIAVVSSFIVCFVFGLLLSLHPAALVVGSHSSLHTYSRWTQWSAYVALILLVLRIDITVTDSMVPSSWMFSEWFQLVTIGIFVLVLLQTLGFVDFTHGERNVQFHYWQIEQGYSSNSWMERYLQQHHGQVAGALVNYCYVLWMTWRSMWPAILILFWYKLWAVEVNGLLSPIISRKEHMPDVVSYLVLDPHIITYTLAGFLWGHIVLHERKKIIVYGNSRALQFVLSRLVVIVGSLLWIGIAVAIMTMPITWDLVINTLSKIR